MKNILKIFFLTVPMLIIGCTNSVAEKVGEENNVTIRPLAKVTSYFRS